MGKDNLFHKRKARANNALKRKKSKRAPYDKVLIVCEGEKTEPNYFNGLINCYKLSTANVEIDGTCGSSPENVFDRAVDLYKKERNCSEAPSFSVKSALQVQAFLEASRAHHAHCASQKRHLG